MLVYRGPQPYTELDERSFFGRDSEIEELVSLVERNRLSVVTAPSGVGKTSVLLAGVVPRLRRRHEEEISSPNVTLGPTIVCRGWSGSTRRSPDRILLDAVVVGVRDLFDSKKTVFLCPSPDAHPGALTALQNEAQTLKNLVEGRDDGSDWLDTMAACAAETGRVVLIFDQFEDALRLPAGRGKKVLQTISSLFNQEPRIRVLLSFRQEFVMNLHDLELSIGGLGKRTYYLQAMQRSSVGDIVIKPAERGEIKVTKEAVQTIKKWLKDSEDQADSRGGEETASGDGASDSEGGEVPLLALQALLVDVHEFLAGRQVINKEGLEEYKRARHVAEKDLAASALENHIDKVLSRRSEDTPVADLLDKMAWGATVAEKDRLMRRLFARMPSHLTSGSSPGSPGYKNQVRLEKLLKEVLREEFELLNFNLAAKEFDDLIGFVRKPNRNMVDMKFAGEADPSNWSGIARRGGWKRERTSAVLVVAIAELLRRLVSGNVLKELGSGAEQAYELVHDGLGPAVQSWAEGFHDSVDDALGSLTKLSGVRFRWLEEDALEGLTIDNVSWSGCVISNQVLANVIFKSCDLRGTMFVGCSFIGGQFENCNLNGAMFIKSKFRPDANDSAIPHIFRGGMMTSALFHECDFWASTLQGLTLDGTVFVGNDVLGRLVITKSNRLKWSCLATAFTKRTNLGANPIAGYSSRTAILCFQESFPARSSKHRYFSRGHRKTSYSRPMLDYPLSTRLPCIGGLNRFKRD